jgi:ribonuclease HII
MSNKIPQFIIGIDEVGRGALAGPVVVAAAMIPRGLRFATLKDSKKLSAKQRESWYMHFISDSKINFAVARIYPRGIERMNISGAANVAALRAVKKILKNDKILSVSIFLDGGLYLGNKKWQSKNMPAANTIVKADEKISAVAIASIIAKVHRDRFMKKLAKRHPEYGFDIHKGYGTEAHRAAIAEYGLCAVHRLTFLGKSNTIH